MYEIKYHAWYIWAIGCACLERKYTGTGKDYTQNFEVRTLEHGIARSAFPMVFIVIETLKLNPPYCLVYIAHDPRVTVLITFLETLLTKLTGRRGSDMSTILTALGTKFHLT